MRLRSSTIRARRGPGSALAAFLIALLAVPGVAYAINLTSAGGFTFDVAETGAGTMANGTIDAYDTAYYLDVDGIAYNAVGAAATLTVGGRQAEMAEITMGALRVKRIVYVPAVGGDYARYLDVVSNPGATDVSVTLRIRGNLGSNTTTVVTGSSSGDTVVSVADAWFATDDPTDGTGDPSLAHVLGGGPGSVASPSTVSLSFDNFSWEYVVVVPAGGRVALLTFAIQSMNRAASIAEAERVVALPADALVGIESYVGDIVNFGGAPIVRFTSPTTADEGAEITIDVEVVDLEGDEATWSWDLDGDGTFGEMPGATTYTVPAGTTDGPSGLTVAVLATDGTHSRAAGRTITIANLPPEITSEPGLTAGVRREYTYQVVSEDAAGALDPADIRLVSRPTGMLMTPEGLITWTPEVALRGTSHSAIVRVLDGDGDQDEQAWTIDVLENQAPGLPTPMSPIELARVPSGERVTLVAENATDPDGDPLVYFFQVARTSTFAGAGVLGSGEVSEGAGGTTSWTTAAALDDGLWYWRVWVGDGIVEGAPRNASFVVGAGGVSDGGVALPDGSTIPLPDAGTGEARGGDCACRAAPGAGRGAGGGLAMALGALGALVIARRRGRRGTEAKR